MPETQGRDQAAHKAEAPVIWLSLNQLHQAAAGLPLTSILGNWPQDAWTGSVSFCMQATCCSWLLCHDDPSGIQLGHGAWLLPTTLPVALMLT